MIKNVIFDLGRVLYTFQPRNYLLELGYSDAQADKIAMCTFGSPLWAEYDRGTYSRDSLLKELCSTHPGMADDFLRVLGDDFTEKVISIIPSHLEFFYEVKRRGFGVYILTNFFDDGFAHCRRRDAFLGDADGIVVSAYEKLVKPEPEIYKLILGRYGLAAEETLFIDDMPENTEAAKKLGIHAITFTNLDDCRAKFEDLVRI